MEGSRRAFSNKQNDKRRRRDSQESTQNRLEEIRRINRRFERFTYSQDNNNIYSTDNHHGFSVTFHRPTGTCFVSDIHNRTIPVSTEAKASFDRKRTYAAIHDTIAQSVFIYGLQKGGVKQISRIENVDGNHLPPRVSQEVQDHASHTQGYTQIDDNNFTYSIDGQEGFTAIHDQRKGTYSVTDAQGKTVPLYEKQGKAINLDMHDTPFTGTIDYGANSISIYDSQNQNQDWAQETPLNDSPPQHKNKGKHRPNREVEDQIASDEMHAYQMIYEEEQLAKEQRHRKQHAQTLIGTSYIEIDGARRDFAHEVPSENTRKQNIGSSRTTTRYDSNSMRTSSELPTYTSSELPVGITSTIQETATTHTDSPLERTPWKHDELITLIDTIHQMKQNNAKVKFTGDLSIRLKKDRLIETEWNDIKKILKDKGITTQSKTGKYLYDYVRSSKAKSAKTALNQGFIDKYGNADVTAYRRAQKEQLALKQGITDEYGNADVAAYQRAQKKQKALNQGFIDKYGNADVTAYRRAQDAKTALNQGFIDKYGNADVTAYQRAQKEQTALNQGFIDKHGNADVAAYQRAQDAKTALNQGFIDKYGNADVTAYRRAQYAKTALRQGFIDKHGNADVAALKRAQYAKAALKQGFTDEYGNADVAAYQRAQYAKTALRQGFIDKHGNADVAAYRREKEQHRKQQYQIRQNEYDQTMNTLNENINHALTERQAQKLQHEQATLQTQWEIFQQTHQTIEGLFQTQDTLNNQLSNPHLDILTLAHIQDQITDLELQIEEHTDQDHQYSEIDKLLDYFQARSNSN